MVNDIGKLILLALALIMGGAVVIVGIVQGDQSAQLVGVGIVGPVIGYMTGNGVLAARGEAPSPAYVPRREKVAERVAGKVAKRVLDQAREDGEVV